MCMTSFVYLHHMTKLCVDAVKFLKKMVNLPKFYKKYPIFGSVLFVDTNSKFYKDFIQSDRIFTQCRYLTINGV